MKEREIVINIENCKENMKQEAGCPDVEMPISVDVIGNGENSLRNGKDLGGVSPDSVGKTSKDRRMTMSAKKPPKPPRPPRGLSLDAADQKLIKEISELLMMKRARIERMKALKTKAAKGLYASSSSSGNLGALLFTLVFCIVIIFQGCHPWGVLPRNSSPVGIHIAPKLDVDIVSLQEAQNLSPSSVHMLSKVGYSNLLVGGSGSGSGNKVEGGRAIR